MIKKFLSLGVVCVILLILTATGAHAESLTLTTYYPAPSGNYTDFKLSPTGGIDRVNDTCDVGSIYVDDTNYDVYFCYDVGGATLSDGKWRPFPGVWKQETDDSTYTNVFFEGLCRCQY